MVKNIKNEGNKNDKSFKTATNHNLNFSTAGPSLLVGAGVTELGGSFGTCCKTRIKSEGQRKQEFGWKVRGCETEQPRERPQETPGKVS